MLLTLVSPVCTLTPLDAAKYKWFIPKEYRLSNEKIYQREELSKQWWSF